MPTVNNSQVSIFKCRFSTLHCPLSASIQNVPPLFPREGLAPRSLLLPLDLRHGSVEHQHPGRHPLPHAHMQVRLAALDVVVQVVAKASQQRNGLLLARALQVPLLQREGYKTRICVWVLGDGQTSHLPQGVFGELYGGRSTYSPLCLYELLQKNPGHGLVRDVCKVDLEYHHHLGGRGYHVHGLGSAVGAHAGSQVPRGARQQGRECAVQGAGGEVAL
mmetsp:Transcript_30303/g.67063  ORF Transcript_30303/g.67063 Transcript_30303/m.67063 type:complete len:219 (-) Transcript_30303:430-1086(-)